MDFVRQGGRTAQIRQKFSIKNIFHKVVLSLLTGQLIPSTVDCKWNLIFESAVSLWIPRTLLSGSCANWQMFRVSLTLRFLLLGRQVCNFVTAEYLQFCNSLTFLLCIHSRPHWWGAENPFSIQISFSWPTLVQGLGNQLLCKCWRALHTIHFFICYSTYFGARGGNQLGELFFAL